MSSLKRSLLLLSIGVFLLAGLVLTSYTNVSSTALASGCNTVATGDWSNNCTVSEGNISNFVLAIQMAIGDSRAGCISPTVDGNFGQNTLTAVKCFQTAVGISHDGIVGSVTWGKLRNLLTFDHFDAGWDYYRDPTFENGTAWRKWDSSGVWYVHVTTTKWYQINLSSPCA